MIDCDERPGRPPDRTVCGDRRSCGFGSPGSGSTPSVDRRGTGVSGRGPGIARIRHRAPLDPVRLLPAGASVPIPARRAWLPQAAQGGRAVAGRGDHAAGPGVCLVVRRPVPDRRDPPAVRCFPRDCQTLGVGRLGWLRALRGALSVLLGPEAVRARRPGRDAHRLVPGQPEDRRTRGLPGPDHYCGGDRATGPGYDGAGLPGTPLPVESGYAHMSPSWRS